jgi:hypothetical protein
LKYWTSFGVMSRRASGSSRVWQAASMPRTLTTTAVFCCASASNSTTSVCRLVSPAGLSRVDWSRPRGIWVVDDYGHHPTEVKATLAAAKIGSGGRRIVVLFQPHRYSRTHDLMEEFARSFNNADTLFVTTAVEQIKHDTGVPLIASVFGYALIAEQAKKLLPAEAIGHGGGDEAAARAERARRHQVVADERQLHEHAEARRRGGRTSR